MNDLSNTSNISIFETFNAKHLSPMEIAKNFVPPNKHYTELLTVNNHIVIGPRGSGKTTLLKMLTLPAFAQINERSKSEDLSIAPPKFVGVFVPADRSWREQLSTNAQNDMSAEVQLLMRRIARGNVCNSYTVVIDRHFRRYETAFYIFRLRFCRNSTNAICLTSVKSSLASLLADLWDLKLDIKSLLGMTNALRKRIVKFGEFRGESKVTKDIRLGQ